MAQHAHTLVAPSLLSADFGALNQAVDLVNVSQADWFHLDVMDGRFVPNISFGFPIIKAIQARATKPLDVHLMIEHPELYLRAFKEAGANVLTVHLEACTHVHRTLSAIRDLDMKAGLAFNPHSSLDVLQDLAPILDLVLIMSVNPGFGGQRFIPATYRRIERARRLLHQNGGEDVLIEVDGGVSVSNAAELKKAGAQVLVAGSSVFGASDPYEAIKDLHQA